jgi:hypothetical protein
MGVIGGGGGDSKDSSAKDLEGGESSVGSLESFSSEESESGSPSQSGSGSSDITGSGSSESMSEISESFSES